MKSEQRRRRQTPVWDRLPYMQVIALIGNLLLKLLERVHKYDVLFIKFASLDYSGPAIQQSDL